MNGSKIQVFLYIVIAVLGGGIIAFNIYKSKTPTVSTAPQNSAASDFKKQPATSFFTTQTAATTGKILAVKGNLLTIENTNHEKQEFPVAKSVFIFQSSPGKPSTPSADLKQITLNKEALINFSMEQDQFLVTSILYSDIPNAPLPLQQVKK